MNDKVEELRALIKPGDIIFAEDKEACLLSSLTHPETHDIMTKEGVLVIEVRTDTLIFKRPRLGNLWFYLKEVGKVLRNGAQIWPLPTPVEIGVMESDMTAILQEEKEITPAPTFYDMKLPTPPGLLIVSNPDVRQVWGA